MDEMTTEELLAMTDEELEAHFMYLLEAAKHGLAAADREARALVRSGKLTQDQYDRLHKRAAEAIEAIKLEGGLN